jgi:hypothetical protein
LTFLDLLRVYGGAYDGAVREHLSLLAYRLLPFAAFAAIVAEIPRSRRAAALFAFLAVAAGLALSGERRVLALITLAHVYFLAAAVVIFCIGKAIGSSRSAMVLAAIASIVLGAGVPVSALRAEGPLFWVLGWDFMLSAFSYCADTRRERPTLRDCLTFLVVDPSLVYRGRAAPAARPTSLLRSGARAASGSLAMLTGTGFRVMAAALLLRAEQTDGAPAAVLYACSSGAVFASLYAAHSGLASIQIGCMRGLGFAIAERYHYPLFARDVADFWRRWNTYVGRWFSRYVFVPTSMHLSRRFLRIPTWVPKGIALVATFTAVGLMHDALIVAATGRSTIRMSIVFGSVGLAICVWHAITGWFRRWSGVTGSDLPGGAFALISRFAVLALLLTVSWYWA